MAPVDEKAWGSKSVASSVSTCSGSSVAGSVCTVRSTTSSQFELGRLLGSGSMGCVYKAKDMHTGAMVAVKQASFDEVCPVEVERLRTEIRITSSLSHRNVVKCIGHEWAVSEVSIYLEFASMGCVASYLKEFGRLTGKFLRSATTDLVTGVSYLHSLEVPVLHRDLKAANLLLREDRSLAIADFGCSLLLDGAEACTELVGSAPWMAPEVITKKAYALEADVWSLGCTTLEMATGERPWGNGAFDNLFAAMRKIGMTQETPPIPAEVPADCASLIARCTRRAAAERPTSQELLDHRYIAKVTSSTKLSL